MLSTVSPWFLSLGAVLLSSCLIDCRALRRPEEKHKAFQLEALKKGILEYLGMDRPPEFRQRASQEELSHLHQQYRGMMQRLGGNSSQVGEVFPVDITTAVLVPSTVEPLKNGLASDVAMDSRIQWYRAVFHRTSVFRRSLTLAHAQLKLYKQLMDNPQSGQSKIRQEVHVKIHNIRCLNSPSFIQMKDFALTNDLGTQNATFDVSAIVQKWLEHSSEPLAVDVGFVSEELTPQSTPQIMLELDLMSGKVRKARSIVDDSSEDENKCSRKSLSVSFKDIGWSDWVVAPTGYTMQFCDGACPHNYKPASMHTQVKSRLHHMTKGATPRPCCVPASYEPMILMHYDGRGKLKLTPFNDLIVTKCHCA